MKACVLVMSGSFNPPTVAHLGLLGLARDAAEERGYTVLKGLFVPTHGAYGKPGLASAEQRVAMCRATAAATDWTEVDAHDTEQERWSRVVDTLAHVQSLHPGARVFFVCGADRVLRWSEPAWPPEQVAEILEKYGALVAARGEAVAAAAARVPAVRGHEAGLLAMEANPLAAVSSTLVRGLLARRRQIAGMVVPAVERYVREHGLYA